MTSKEALLDIQKRNEALKKEGHFHIGSLTMGVIEQLVERDTPLKITNPYIESPVHKGDKVLKESQCKCKGPINNDFSFCPYCGQRLDWSE